MIVFIFHTVIYVSVMFRSAFIYLHLTYHNSCPMNTYLFTFIFLYSIIPKKGGFALFGVGFSEIILILVIAYIFVGPQDLPKVARWLGRIVKRTRLLISEIKTESGWNELLQETQELYTEINGTIKENKDLVQKSFSGVQEEFRDVQQELSKNIDEAEKSTLS